METTTGSKNFSEIIKNLVHILGTTETIEFLDIKMYELDFWINKRSFPSPEEFSNIISKLQSGKKPQTEPVLQEFYLIYLKEVSEITECEICVNPLGKNLVDYITFGRANRALKELIGLTFDDQNEIIDEIYTKAVFKKMITKNS